MTNLWEYRAGVNHDVANMEVDGDTIDVRADLGFDMDGLGMRLRLLGVDCPEKNEPLPWLYAKVFTAQWLKDHADSKGRYFMRTIPDTRGRDKKDSFGRYLAQIYDLVDGETQGTHCLNDDLLTSGNAVVYR